LLLHANYNAVDRNDRDSADYSTTICTNRYYLRIFFWALDRVIHAVYIVVCFLIKSDIGQKEWKWYFDGHSGRHDFQIDLALSLMNYGIGLHFIVLNNVLMYLISINMNEYVSQCFQIGLI